MLLGWGDGEVTLIRRVRQKNDDGALYFSRAGVRDRMYNLYFTRPGVHRHKSVVLIHGHRNEGDE